MFYIRKNVLLNNAISKNVLLSDLAVVGLNVQNWCFY